MTKIFYDKKDNSATIRNKLNFKTHFPNKIYEMIEIRLHHLQSLVNDIIDNTTNLVEIGKLSNTENKIMRHRKLSVFRSIRRKQKRHIKRIRQLSENKDTTDKS